MRKPLGSKKTRCSVNCLKEVYNAAHYHLPTFTMSGNNINSVFYAELYHPIQAGSIDGTDIHPHDNAICRALLCSSAGLCMCFYFLYSFPPPTPLRQNNFLSIPSSYPFYILIILQMTPSVTPRPLVTLIALSLWVGSLILLPRTLFARLAVFFFFF